MGVIRIMFGFGEKAAPPLGDGTCIWVSDVGGIRIRVFKIVARHEGQVKIDFGNDETYKIAQKNIRANRVLIYKLPNGKVVVQDPDKWKKIDLKGYDIKELRFNLQNFALQEGKSSIHRWTVPPDRVTKLSPLLKLLMICIAIGVLGWSALKFSTYVLDVVMSSRVLDCAAVVPKAFSQIPIGAIQNATAPLGA